MPLHVNYLSLLFFGLVWMVSYVSTQDACERITTGDLGDSTMLSGTGLIADILSPAGQGVNIVSVRVLNMNIVCEAQHMMENRYRYTSVVVSFNCFTTDNRVPECMDNTVVNTEQFDLGCSSGQWTQTILTVSDSARTINPIATLTTPLDTGCILCINPNHLSGGPSVNNVTHCLGCTNCGLGLQRCYYDGSSNEVCCNYFNEGTCVTECPSPLVPNVNFMCAAGTITTAGTTGTTIGTTSATINTLPPRGCDTGCIVGTVVGVILLVVVVLVVVAIIIVVVYFKKKMRKAAKPV